jgi:hypothetical protein
MSHDAILVLSAVVLKERIFNMPNAIDMEGARKIVVIDPRQG